MRKKSTMKIARGRLEEDRRKSDDKFEYQRVMLFILPLLMISVLVVGVYFGYLSYSSNYVNKNDIETRTMATEPQFTQSENEYLLTVVSSANPVDSDFVPQLSVFEDIEVSPLILDDLEKMLADAAQDGVDIRLASGYVSFKEQKELYESKVKSYKKAHKCSSVKAEAAVKKTTSNAGESEQQTGLLVEFTNEKGENFKNSDEYLWLIKNGVNYGFILRYPEKENTGGLKFNANLFRYVSVEHALLMRSYNMNLDEYVQYLNAQ